MATNPSYQNVKVGDIYSSSQIMTFQNHSFFYISEVVSVESITERFGKPDRIVKVKTVTNEGSVVNDSRNIWVSQLLQGLI